MTRSPSRSVGALMSLSRTFAHIAHAALIAYLLVLNGCSTKVRTTHFNSDHPTNPDAPSSPVLHQSRTLDVAAADPILPPRTQAIMAPGHDHHSESIQP